MSSLTRVFTTSGLHRLRYVAIIAIVCGVYLLLYDLAGDPRAISDRGPLHPPDEQHILGTDTLGRDVFSRVVHGGWRTLTVASLATAIAVLTGLFIGTLAGYLGGPADAILLILLNGLAALPGLIIALVLLTIFEQGFLTLAVAAGFTQIAIYGHFTRSVVRGLRYRDYITAAEALGRRRISILYSHILVSAAPQLLSYGSVVFSYTIISSTSLSFLGLSGDPAAPEWGAMLAEGRLVLGQMPWISVIPAFLITVSVLTVNALANSLTLPMQAG